MSHLQKDDGNYFRDAVELLQTVTEPLTIPILQRRLRIGWFRAKRIMDELKERGYL